MSRFEKVKSLDLVFLLETLYFLNPLPRLTKETS